MTNGVLYFIGQEGTATAFQSLAHLHPKTIARSLALIDLLEEPDLPNELDKSAKGEHHSSLRILKARMGQAKLRFAYTLHENNPVVISAGALAKGQPLAKLALDFERAITGKAKSSKPAKQLVLKSHRETVAEMTLSDPVLAAHYAKARERAQFALSLIRLRDKASLTNETLSQRTGLTLKLVNNLTHGKLPTLATMRSLADALQARVVIGPAGGIVLEAHEAIDIPGKQLVKSETSRSSVPSEPIGIGELLLVQ